MTVYRNNPLLSVDSYKWSHHNLLPPGTTHMNSYIESRGGAFDRALFFGAQIAFKTFLAERVTESDVTEAESIVTAHGLTFNRTGFDRLVNMHGGYWPVQIEAVPEGTVLPVSNVLLQIRNTDPEMPWVTSFLETALLRAIWYPTTVATVSYHAKQIILNALRESSDDPVGQIPFKLHDFSARGVSSGESAAIGGLAHLVNFQGTDTMEALVAARRFYHEPMAGFSIPASEHAVITSWGREHESAAYAHMLQQYAKPGTMWACVSDSYDIWHAVNNIWGDELRQQVLDSGATLVVRPDSGDPLTVPVQVIQALGERFGYTVNTRGYRVLPSAVRVIQGDGITVQSLPLILNNLLQAGWSADNLAFGMGAGLAQKVDRDTLRFAMKANAICVNGEWRDVFKDPVTDPGKQSKRGILSVTRSGGIGYSRWRTTRRDALHVGETDYLTPVWRNGELLVDHTLTDIRARSQKE
jgi:nicotinamide phosphoribosyltransferase